MKESAIRDYLSSNIEVINSDFEFLNKEKYIKNEICTKSFIDIFAINHKTQRYVIIEIKRSNEAAREAIHEINKYFVAVKNHMGLSSDELELVVASTEWEELIVPFSAFVNNSQISITGYMLSIDNDKIKSTEIAPIPDVLDRFFGIAHSVHYYLSEDSLKKGITSHENFFNNHGITSFVLIILKAPANYLEMLKYSTSKSYEDLGLPVDSKLDEWVEANNFKYMIYSANLLKSKEKYLSYFKTTTEEVYQEYISEILESKETSDLDKIEDLNTHLISGVGPFPESDYFEIGNSAKFLKFKEMGWEIDIIKRYGTLKENNLLSDDTIENEISGSTGTTGEIYSTTIRLQDKSNLDKELKRIKICLQDNPVWYNDIIEIISTLKDKKVGHVKCDIFNPMNIIYTLYLVYKNKDFGYIPSYILSYEDNEITKFYIGYIGTNKDFNKKKQIKSIVKTYFEDDLGFILTLRYGGYTPDNLKICSKLGIEYKSMLLEKIGDEVNFYKLSNHRFLKCDLVEPVNSFMNIYTNPDILEYLEYLEQHNTAPGMFEF